MSRVYRVLVNGILEKVEHLEDRVCGSLELLPVLPKERMQVILAGELAKRGFTVEGNVARKSPEPGIVIELDLEASTVTVKAESDLEVKLYEERTIVGGNPGEEAAGRRGIQENLERVAAEKAELARREVTEKLEKSLRGLKSEIDDAVTRATGEALKEKARSMGEIKEITEDPETGSLTIKIEL